jgi:hypothetical protein
VAKALDLDAVAGDLALQSLGDTDLGQLRVQGQLIELGAAGSPVRVEVRGARIERCDLVGIVHGANLAHDRRFHPVFENPLALKRIAVGADDFKPEEGFPGSSPFGDRSRVPKNLPRGSGF